MRPVGVILADDCIVEPDLVYVAKARAEIVKLRAIEGPPDLIVEILSKSTGKRDRSTKANLYARYRVANYWIFDPDARTVDISERGKRRYKRVGQFRGNTTFSAQPFPTFQIDLPKIWR
jgi:Uma2 family endonuclease